MIVNLDFDMEKIVMSEIVVPKLHSNYLVKSWFAYLTNGIVLKDSLSNTITVWKF